MTLYQISFTYRADAAVLRTRISELRAAARAAQDREEAERLKRRIAELQVLRTSEYGGIPEWPKGADCKSVVSDFGGSNPPSPTKKIVTPYGVTIFLFERRADPPSLPKPPAVFRIHPFPPNSIPKSISITS